MKKSLSLVLALALLASCGATRKAATSNESLLDSTTAAKEVVKQTEKAADTTRTEHGKITITEIEFYPPATTGRTQGELAKHREKGEEVAEKKARPPTTTSVDLANVGKVQGSVKSIKQTVIESDVEKRGESKESSESNETESAATLSRNETNTEMRQEPTPGPYRWRYIFYIVAVGAAALLYLKRVPILNWIKRILSGLRRIF